MFDGSHPQFEYGGGGRGRGEGSSPGLVSLCMFFFLVVSINALWKCLSCIMLNWKLFAFFCFFVFFFVSIIETIECSLPPTPHLSIIVHMSPEYMLATPLYCWPLPFTPYHSLPSSFWATCHSPSFSMFTVCKMFLASCLFSMEVLIMLCMNTSGFPLPPPLISPPGHCCSL